MVKGLKAAKGLMKIKINFYINNDIIIKNIIQGGMESVLETCCGSPAYAAPELLIVIILLTLLSEIIAKTMTRVALGWVESRPDRAKSIQGTKLTHAFFLEDPRISEDKAISN